MAALLQHHLGESHTTQKHLKCNREARFEAGIKECLRSFRESCLGYGIRAIKTVRLSIADAELLLKVLPNLKVIHQIRDPRGMLLSRSSLGEFPWSTVDSGSKAACDEIVANLNSSERLHHLYPNRIKTILYEKIAEMPLEALKEIYNFSNITVDKTTDQWLKNATMSGKEVKCTYCSTKANSTITAYKWRQTLQFRFVWIIDRNCKSLYDKLGYKPIYHISDLRNVAINTRISVRYLNNNL